MSDLESVWLEDAKTAPRWDHPRISRFYPDGLASGDAIDMTVDELEVLRLCDLEGLNQEAVAQHMGIARATVTAICSRAHRKVADALVNGRALVIEGGNIAYSPSPRQRPHGQQRRSTP